MKQWFFGETPAFEPATGFETSFLIECDGEEFIHQWKIVDVIEKEKIVYDWSYKDRPGRGMVTWNLKEIPSGTRLTLTNDVVESFPEEIPAFRRESCEAGWQYFINERLVAHLT